MPQIDVIPWQANNNANLTYLREEKKRLTAKSWEVEIVEVTKKQRRLIKLVRFIYEQHNNAPE